MNQRTLQTLLDQARQEGVFPSAGAAFSHKKNRVRAFTGPVDKETLFDLASLTKPLSTSLLLYTLFTQEQIHPEDRLARVWQDELPFDKGQLTLRSLLNHSSGLPAYYPWFQEFAPVQRQENKALLMQRIITAPLSAPPQTYSDLGFMLLGNIVEQVYGQDLATAFREQISLPLGLEQELLFCPPAQRDCAATEFCRWRGRVIQGEVHDEHCWLLGGQAGHAGLFGTLEGVLQLCEAILDQWIGTSSSPWGDFLSQGHIPGCTWCLGFDTPSPGTSSSGRYFSPQSLGHLGFTGTSFWIDPDHEVIVVLLSNRVHPSRENKKIQQFRPIFHDLLMEEFVVNNIEGRTGIS